MTANHCTAAVYTAADAAGILRVKQSCLKRQAAARKIPFTMLGGACRLTADDLAAIVQMHEKMPSPLAVHAPASQWPELSHAGGPALCPAPGRSGTGPAQPVSAARKATRRRPGLTRPASPPVASFRHCARGQAGRSGAEPMTRQASRSSRAAAFSPGTAAVGEVRCRPGTNTRPSAMSTGRILKVGSNDRQCQ
jgi:hypothetical protein